MLPGPHFEERQQLPSGLHKKRKSQGETGIDFTLGLFSIHLDFNEGKRKTDKESKYRFSSAVCQSIL